MRTFWKFYFWVLLALYSAAIAGVFFAALMSPSPNGTANWLRNLVFGLHVFGAVVGVYGYSFRKAIFSRNVWKVAFLFVVADEMYGLLFLFTTNHQLPIAQLVIATITWQILMMPQYVALFLYGWRSTEFWQHYKR